MFTGGKEKGMSLHRSISTKIFFGGLTLEVGQLVFERSELVVQSQVRKCEIGPTFVELSRKQ